MPFVIQKHYSPKPQKAFLFLMRELGYSIKEAQRLIAKGRLFINGEAITNPSVSVEGDFEFVDFEPHSRGLNPIFITEGFALYDKPSGVLVHPQNRHTPYSLNDEIKLAFGRDANVAHRIDQETSGLVLVGTNKESERLLKIMFENRHVTKRYLAFVQGHLENSMLIDEPLYRRDDPSAAVRMIVLVDPRGKSSQTHIHPLKYYPELNATLIQASPLTGRQHQIRAHLFHVKHPIIGDPIYSMEEKDAVRYLDRVMSKEERFEKTKASRLLLHANQLEFIFEENKYVLYSKDNFIEECFKAMQFN